MKLKQKPVKPERYKVTHELSLKKPYTVSNIIFQLQALRVTYDMITLDGRYGDMTASYQLPEEEFQWNTRLAMYEEAKAEYDKWFEDNQEAILQELARREESNRNKREREKKNREDKKKRRAEALKKELAKLEEELGS
jgi:hypothetical protein